MPSIRASAPSRGGPRAARLATSLLCGLALPLVVATLPALAGAGPVAAAGVPSPRAYPIAPVPLRELVQGSELIVVLPGGEGSVVQRPGRGGRDKLLTVQEVLHGDDPGPVVTVRVGPWICPAPADYDEHTRLAFLLRDEQGTWWTQGLSYGARALSDGQLEVWTARIRELLALERIEDEDQLARALGDWQLRCLGEPATRDEAVLDLNAQLAAARRKRSGGSDVGPSRTAVRALFSDPQRRRLVALAIDEARRGRPEGDFLRLVDDLAGDDPRLPAAWVELGWQCLAGAGSTWALRIEPELRRLLTTRLADQQLTTLGAAVVAARREQAWGPGHVAALERYLERARELTGDDGSH